MEEGRLESLRFGGRIWAYRIGSGWFSNVAVRKVGNGSATLFWKDIWMGYEALCSRLPRLFLISEQKENNAGDMCSWERDLWVWK